MPIELELTGIQAGYGEMPALFGVTLKVPAASVTALLGSNGAGKTTLLRVASGLVRPWKGSVRFRGASLDGVGIRERARQGLCLIPEGRGIFPTLTVKENLLIQTHLVGRGSAGEIEEKAYGRFRVLGERRNQIAGTLSGGEQQMLALSRSLTTNPKVVLMDEISMGLAPLIVESLFEVVRQMASEGMTILLVEQMAQESLEISDYVYVMNQGRMRAVGQPADVEEVIVSTYLGGVDGEGSASSNGNGSAPQDRGWNQAQLLATEKGSMAHRFGCPVIASSPNVHPIDGTQGFAPCALCDSTVSAVG
jgi:branched-chain amino acid transport system ATP-binding protein